MLSFLSYMEINWIIMPVFDIDAQPNSLLPGDESMEDLRILPRY